MPSSALAELSKIIEDQPTDSLGKFYMYAALLNFISTDIRTFQEALPKDTRAYSTALKGFGRQTELNTGALNSLFFEQLNIYKKQFQSPTPDGFIVVTKIVQAYCRQGQLGDLVFINDKMLAHLHATTEQSVAQNKSIYETTNFGSMKTDIINLIIAVKAVHDNSLSCIDNGIKLISCGLAALIGLVIVVTAALSLIHLLLGFALVTGGIYGASLFFDPLCRAASGIEETIQSCMTKAQEVVGNIQKKVVLGENILARSFIINSILKPLSYSAITIREQVTIEHEDVQINIEMRENLRLKFT